ncbi:MAG: cbb3-type cytochrome c oxidase subunit 3 [Chromatiales bacterium]|nr:cbb3-type cytochrome c oxidase subunit 3 [Chromatiales bacterium]
MENTKPLALVIFFVVFVGILLYVFANKKRSKRLESYKNIPFLEDDEAGEQKDKDSRNG